MSKPSSGRSRPSPAISISGDNGGATASTTGISSSSVRPSTISVSPEAEILQEEFPGVERAPQALDGPHARFADPEEISDSQKEREVKRGRREVSSATSGEHGATTTTCVFQDPDSRESNPRRHPNPLLLKPFTWLQSVSPVPLNLLWAKPHLNWRGLKPVIRASVAGWIGLILLVDPTTLSALGQAGFLLLIVATIAPASDPVAAGFEKYMLMVVFVGAAWLYSCITLRIAYVSRREFDIPDQVTMAADLLRRYPDLANSDNLSLEISKAVFRGDYIEWRCSLVCALSYATGGAFCLWLRGYAGPGPFIFAIIFTSIMLSIVLTFGPFFPYPYYALGEIFYYPFLSQIAVNMACTILIFPQTLQHQFAERLAGTLAPLRSVLNEQKTMLATPPTSPEWLKYASMENKLSTAMQSIGTLGAIESVLSREIAIRRYSGRDSRKFLLLTRRLATRAWGFIFFQNIVATHIQRELPEDASPAELRVEDFVVHVAPSRPPSPDTYHPSPPETPERLSTHESRLPAINEKPADSARPIDERLAQLKNELRDVPASSRSSVSSNRRRSTSRNQSYTRLQPPIPVPKTRGHYKSTSHTSLTSFLHGVLDVPHPPRPVGILESQRYADLEDFLSNPLDEAHIGEIIALLKETSLDLLEALDHAQGHFMEFLGRVQSAGIWEGKRRRSENWVQRNEQALTELRRHKKEFVDVRRLRVTSLFAGLFDPRSAHATDLPVPSHRGLFWSYLYIYSLIQYTEAVEDLLIESVKVEKERSELRLRIPQLASMSWTRPMEGEDDPSADPDPENVPGLRELRHTSKRDPDSYPPTNRVQVVGNRLHHLGRVFGRPDIIFAIKAGLLIGLISLPAFMKFSAHWMYSQRGIWSIIMAMLTLNQYVGDTLFGWVNRVIGTLFGATVGLAIWYCGAGTGTGSPYGLCAVCAIAFPFLFFFRIYYPAIMTAIVASVTVGLVVGYSWQDGNQPAGGSIGYGWVVGWKRFVAVLIGITAAFIWSAIPPRSTQKQTLRRMYARLIQEEGELLADIISFAALKKGPQNVPRALTDNWAALRRKLVSTNARRNTIGYELSLRGPWPAKEYSVLHRLSVELLDSMASLLNIFASLDAKWTRALLRRTRFCDPRFVGEVASVFQLISSALRNSSPLPYVYMPLVEQFLKPSLGFEITRDELSDLPTHVDLEVISSLEYLQFSVGVSYAYAITNRLDRIMFVTKQLVGESYIVYGLDDAEDLHLLRHADGDEDA